MTTPKICPFCGTSDLQKGRNISHVWVCGKCSATFVALRLPTPLEPTRFPSPERHGEAMRTDLIAQAYRGRLSRNDALLLAEYLVTHARQTTKHGKSLRKGVPFNYGYCLNHPIFKDAPILEITP